MPAALLTLFRFVFDGQEATFDRIGAPLVGLFPFTVMFLVTSIAMLRERTTGTLERLMSLPLGKADVLLGYGLAFGLVAAVQATITSDGRVRPARSRHGWACLLVIALAVANALLGMALGLFLSAFATTEFQAVQFMPAVVIPQILLSGLLVPREQMAEPLQWLSNLLPLTYAYDALAQATLVGELDSELCCRRRGSPRLRRRRACARRRDAAATDSLGELGQRGSERLERGLPPTVRGDEPGLPARRVALVLEQEPEQHVDPRMRLRDRERLPHVPRLRRPRDTENHVRRVRLVAVLRQPDPLGAVEPSQLGDEVVDVAERDAATARRRVAGDSDGAP